MRWIGLVLVASVALVLATCTPAAQAPAAAPAAPKAPAPGVAPAAAPAPAKPKAPSGTLTVGVNSMGSEDWLLRESQTGGYTVAWSIGDPLYGLSRKDSATFDPREGLLDSWKLEVKGEDAVVTMVLKRGIPWHNNEGVVTSQDVKFAEEHFLLGGHNSNIAQRPSTYNKDINNVEIVDDITVRYNLKAKWLYPDFQKMYSGIGGYLMPKAYVARVGEAGYNKQPVNTGPFKMVEHVSDTRVTLEAVPNHYRKTPEYEKLVVLKVPEPSTRLAMLLTGQIAITSIVGSQASQVEKNAKTRVLRNPGGPIYYFLGGLYNKYDWEGVRPAGKMSTTKIYPTYDPKIPWVGEDWLAPDKVKVRYAMDIAIDRQAIADQVYLGYAVPTAGFQSYDLGANTPGHPWYKRWPVRPYDPQKAKKLLAEAGYPNGFSMNFWVTDYTAYTNPVSVAIAGFWEKNLNIKVNLKSAQYNPTVRQNYFARSFADHAFVFGGGGPVLAPPFSFIHYCSSCPMTYFEHPITDELVSSMGGVLDKDKATAISQKIGDFIYDNVVGTGVVSGQILWGIHKDYVKEWNKSELQSELVGLEYLVKP